MNSLSTQQRGKAVGFGGIGIVGRFVAAVAVTVLAGCATIGAQSPEAAVKERAQERWDALVKGDFKAAYAYLSPGSKQVISEKDYVQRLRKGFWKSAEVGKVTCASPQSCQAQVSIEYEFQGLRTRTPLHESWIREGSTWWYVLKS